MKLNQFVQSYVDVVEGDYTSIEKAISDRVEYASRHVVRLPDDPPPSRDQLQEKENS